MMMIVLRQFVIVVVVVRPASVVRCRLEYDIDSTVSRRRCCDDVIGKKRGQLRLWEWVTTINESITSANKQLHFFLSHIACVSAYIMFTCIAYLYMFSYFAHLISFCRCCNNLFDQFIFIFIHAIINHFSFFWGKKIFFFCLCVCMCEMPV